MGGSREPSPVGLDVRADFVRAGLFATEERKVYRTVREDGLSTSGVSPWAEHEFSWNVWLRSLVGVRGDIYAFDVHDQAGGVSRSTARAIASP